MTRETAEELALSLGVADRGDGCDGVLLDYAVDLVLEAVEAEREEWERERRALDAVADCYVGEEG